MKACKSHIYINSFLHTILELYMEIFLKSFYMMEIYPVLDQYYSSPNSLTYQFPVHSLIP